MRGEALGRPESSGPEDQWGALIQDSVYAAVLRSLPDTAVFVFGPDLRYRLVEGSGLGMTGWTAEELIGRCPSELVPDRPDEACELEASMLAALQGETRIHEMNSLRTPDGYWQNTVSPLTTADGQIVGGLIVSRNLEALRRAEAERSRSEQAAERWSEAALRERLLRERLEFLAGIDGVLAGCRDRKEIMRAVVRAAVPRLGDWCSIHVLMDTHDTTPVVEVAHVDPEMVRVAEDVIQRFSYDPEGTFGIPLVIRANEPILMNGLDPAALEAAMPDPTGAAAIRKLELTSSLIVPISVGAFTFGALTFSVTGAKRSLDEDDLTLAQALAGRVGVSLENRRLGEVERTIAATLQRSLLPSGLPVLPRAQVAVRYWAAGEGTEVGGDFYDVFATGHGAHAVVIGDVCGSGPAAAAVTATVRHTIRALARHGDDHATVLSQLNDAVLTSWPDIFCTVTYATLVPVGRGLELTAVSGGHPLPIVVRADGTASTAGRPGMLIGAFDIPEPEPFQAHLEPGDTVVFYTDGVYDLPPPRYLSDGELQALVAEAAGGTDDAESVADRIAQRLEGDTPFGDRDDDVAVVVVKVVPESSQA